MHNPIGFTQPGWESATLRSGWIIPRGLPTQTNEHTANLVLLLVNTLLTFIMTKYLMLPSIWLLNIKRETGVNTKFCKVYYNSLKVAFIGKSHKQYDQMLKLKVAQFFFKSCPKCCQISLYLKRDVFQNSPKVTVHLGYF